MSALKNIFSDWQEGDEYDIGDQERWTLLNVGRGDFVELSLGWTDWSPPSEATVGFLILGHLVTGDGGVALKAHFVGATDQALSKRLSSQFNRREGFVHLCVSRPCTEAEESFIHATRVKVFSREGFNPSYYTASYKRQVAKWLGESEEVSTVGEGLREDGGEPLSDRSILPDFSWIPTSGREGGEHSREEERGRGVTRASPKRRGALRTGPAAQGRARVRGKGIAGEAGAGDRSGHPRSPVVQEGLKVGATSDGGVAVEEDLELGTEKEREEMSTAELRRKLEGVRLKLGGAPRPSISELRKLPEEEDGEDHWQEDALRSGSAEDVKGLTSGSSLKRKKAVEDSRGSTTRNVSEQLVRQAQQLAAGKARKSEDERSRSESRGGERAELLALLNQAAKKTSKGDGEDRDPPRRSGDSGHSKKKKKKKRNKKDKKKRRRRRLVNGVIISSSGSSYSSEETSRSVRSLSEGDFEAPLRKRSKAAPGSVLKLLVQRAQDALDQGALVETTGSSSTAITDGVKLTTYYQLHIKPHYGQFKGPMRDIALMARALDTIRAGAIGRACDMLAGHFLAAHQALMDQSWVQARYLEVIEPEEQNATSAAILLEARKHAKTSLKAETFEAWLPGKGWQRSWQGGGKGGWHAEKGKGKQKKGGKSKEKGGWQDKEGKGKNKWKETHDKGDKDKE